MFNKNWQDETKDEIEEDKETWSDYKKAQDDDLTNFVANFRNKYCISDQY